MKVNEIWQSKDKDKEKVRINYIVREAYESDDFVGYTYLQTPKDHEQPSKEDMICRKWFMDNFEKCRI